MKTRRHHNNTGRRQIRNGKTRKQVALMAHKYVNKDYLHCDDCWAYYKKGFNHQCDGLMRMLVQFKKQKDGDIETTKGN